MRLCEVCGERPAVGSCRLCGRSVCSEHLSPSGLCSLCESSLCALCRERLSVASCEVCGRPVCEECSVQLTPVIRVCRECLARSGGPEALRSEAERQVRALALAVSRLLRGPTPQVGV